MKPSLQLRLSQHLALTPQLQQSIRLLQLSTLELHLEVGQMLDQNPFLETEDDSDSTPFETPQEHLAVDRPADRQADRESTETPATDSAEGGDGAGELKAEDFGTTAQDGWENGTEGEDFDGIRETPRSSVGDSDGDNENNERGGGGPSLQEHLHSQAGALRLSAEDRQALDILIESLSDDGYLADTLEEVGQAVAQMLGLQGEEAHQALHDRLRCALLWLQSLEPTGVGARNLAECLVLQLKALALTNKAIRPEVHSAARRICTDHLDLLARRDTKRIAAQLGCDETVVREAHDLIKRCDPKPGRAFARDDNAPVLPDVIVRKSGRGLNVQLNPDVMPKLRINDLFAQAVKGQRGSAGAPGLSARLQEARWFVKNIQQRFDTILRVSRAIVERQKGFFTHGAIAMKPLVLREIADELGLHESTISRVTTAKYMATPQGTFELKYFFGSSLNTEAGGNASSTAVRALIQQFVTAENALKPLSDSQISDMLEEQGIQVARRTVAKYRDALKIAPATLRRAA
jgi:RNA polymerase sigma-54 factor